MKMRFASLLFAGFMVAAPGMAIAYENYIPLGTGYSPNVEELPDINSELSQAIGKADAYETELYLQLRKRAEEESRFRQFFSDRNSNGSDVEIDY
jgi:hypothetical protein